MADEKVDNRPLIVSAVCLVAIVIPVGAIVLAIVGTVTAFIAMRSASARGLASINLVLWLSVILPIVALPFLFLVPSYTESAIGLFGQRLTFLAFAGPQWIFFAETLRRAGPEGGRVVAELLARPADITFWALVAVAFAAMTRRILSVPVIFVAAIATVVVVVIATQAAIPRIGWTTYLDFP